MRSTSVVVVVVVVCCYVLCVGVRLVIVYNVWIYQNLAILVEI